MTEPRTPSVRRFAPPLLDLGIALALCTLALIYIGATKGGLDSGMVKRDALGVALVLAQTLPIAWRQRSPRTVVVVTFVAWIVDRGLSYVDTMAMLGMIVAIHAVGAFLPARSAYRWGGGALAVASVWTALGIASTDEVTWVHLVTMILWVIIPFAMGRADALSRARVTALENAHRRAEANQRTATDVAIRTERARIARELHDVVAHEITVMTLQAEGARRALGDANPAVTEALATISSSGRKGLAEMSRMIGVLRDTAEAKANEAAVGTAYAPASVSHLDPMPGLAALPALAAQVEDAGLPVEVRMEGNAHVPAGVELSAYRIVQESLTNALKHAGPGAQATVVVEREANAVTVTVEDDGRGVVADAIAKGGGHGLTGMRERVLALGGSMDIGPRPGGGFRVRAVLPSHDDAIASRPRRPRAAVPAPSAQSAPSTTSNGDAS